jgi:DNA-binding GntR family transcriptional regulator
MSPPVDVVDALRREILAGEFAPGERLVELQLTQRYRCGRATVRAALVELATEGLVDREANRGATVRRITLAEAIEITEARAALESLAAAHAARNATGEERERLRTVVAEMRDAVTAGDAARYSALNAELHRRIRECSRHRVVAELVENLRNRSRHQQFQLSLMPGRPAESLPQHEAIVEAIVAGHEAAAHAAMLAHLRSVVDVLEHWNALVGASARESS